MATLFRKRGLKTAAFVSLGILDSQYGIDKDFEVYMDRFPDDRWYLTAQEVNLRVFPWIEKNKDQRFFLWIHYSDPHDPYTPPDSPSDLRLYLNDQLTGEYCLDKFTLLEAALNLNKGKNQLRFEVYNDVIKDPASYKAAIVSINFSPPLDQKEIVFSFSKDWFIYKDNSAFLLKNNATIDFNNLSGPRLARFTFQGRLIHKTKDNRENYAREVEYMDREIGRLWKKLQELNLFEKSAIILVGDHGEGLGEYITAFRKRHFGHIHFLYNVYMKVPFIIYNPSDSKKGIRKIQPVTLLDVAPTLADMLGIKKMPAYQGRNLGRLKKDEKLTIYEETYKPEAIQNRFSILHSPWHLIFTPEEGRYELFDLRNDPQEQKNVYLEKGSLSEVKHYKQKLDNFARDILRTKEEIKIDQNTKEMLRALGYIR